MAYQRPAQACASMYMRTSVRLFDTSITRLSICLACMYGGDKLMSSLLRSAIKVILIDDGGRGRWEEVALKKIIPLIGLMC